MSACQQIACGGTIAADSYCDTCGYAAGSAPVAPSPAQAPPAAAQAPQAAQTAPATLPSSPTKGSAAPASTSMQPVDVGSACRQPDCGGVVANDGYCNTCGTAPRTDPAPAGPAIATTGPTAAAASIATTPMAAPTIGAPAAPSTTTRVANATGAMPTTRSQSSRTITDATRLGVGLVDVAPTPVSDPSGAVMSEEKIAAVLGATPEDDRYCTNCGQPVGRSEDGREGRINGFCGNCRTPFDFVTNTPTLKPGDLVGGQYEILGPLAHGGMGWIYLGRDRAVSDRWVVLKGLLNEHDADAIASAVAERQFLAQIEHGNIVNIYNFVTWGGAGYIVMEFVGGASLNSKLKDRREANNGVPDPLPITDAIAYILGVLPALGYLHRMDLVYNDLKPANVMATGDDVKLIDVGGVMRLDDHDAAIFGTQGFQAPEVARVGPSITSDLYTVGRTLAVMTLNFVFHAGEFLYALPGQADEPLFAHWESYYRFLLKATATHPTDRFQTAEAMVAQLTGVLREIVAIQQGAPRPVPSGLFAGDRLSDLLHDANDDTTAVGADWRALPTTKVVPTDPSASFLLDLPEDDPTQTIQLIDRGLEAAQVQPTVELLLVRTHALLLTGQIAEADRTLHSIELHDPWEWRTVWLRGLMALRSDQPGPAADLFSQVWTELPGEIAPKLAVALSAEMAGDHARAAQLYAQVAAVDTTYVSASFGLARCRSALGDREGALMAYRLVPPSSATYLDAQVASARTLVFDRPTQPSAQELAAAATTIERLQLDATERATLAAQIFEEALEGMQSGKVPPSPDLHLFGEPFTEKQLRTGLESTYRELARTADSAAERVALVDRANQIRPLSLF